MALLNINFLSQSLCRITTVQMFIPNDLNPEERRENLHYNRPLKVLYLLHGYSGNYTDWIQGTAICNLAKKYNFAVVCPSGDNSFYFDQEMTGGKYRTFVGVELPSYISKSLRFLFQKRRYLYRRSFYGRFRRRLYCIKIPGDLFEGHRFFFSFRN